MHPEFREYVEQLMPAFERLMQMTPILACDLPRTMPKRGVYLLSEGEDHQYVGRSNRLRKRIRNHGRENSTHKQAAFAMRLARKASGYLKATYKTEGSRAWLSKDPVFRKHLAEAKSRIAKMHIRFVEMVEPNCQALLEMYVAIVLKTPHNDFDNH